MPIGEYDKKFVDILPEPMLLVEKDGRIVSVNKAALELFETSFDALVRQNFCALVAAPSQITLLYLRECSQAAEFHIGLFVFKNAQGAEIPCRCDGALLARGDATVLVVRLTPRTEFNTRFIALNEQIDALNRARHDLENEVRLRTADLLQARKYLQELSARLMQAQDEERRRLARELHDSTGQTLTAIQLNLTLLLSDTGLPSDSQARLTQTVELTNQAISEVRTLSHLLHPPLLDEAGLPLALRNFIEGFEERSKIAVAVDLPETFERVAPELETALFRIVQECLTNVHRHSGSTEASVRLEVTDGTLELEVRDQGRGILEDSAGQGSGKKPGVGVRGMQERVRLLGGTFQFLDARPGARVRVTIPSRRSTPYGGGTGESPGSTRRVMADAK